MSRGNVLVHIDGREVVVPRLGVRGMVLLASVGANPERGDVLVRDDGGYARIVAAAGEVEIAVGVAATFRVHRDGRPVRIDVDGRVWEWGAAAIWESDIRMIAGVPDDMDLSLCGDRRSPIRRGALIDLSVDWTPRIVSRESACGRKMVADAGRGGERGGVGQS